MDAATARPRHIAIIMDGNGRWAKRRHLPRNAGHKAGVTATRKIVEACGERDIEVLTLFAFSSENWNRPAAEVRLLMELFVLSLRREVPDLDKNNVRLRFIGERDDFPAKLQQAMADAEAKLANNTGLQLNIAAGYGGQADITRATRKLAQRALDGQIAVDDITAETLSAELFLAGQPDPDLFIRTGGESRISNFLLWNLAYAELYFCDTLWPDFDPAKLDEAIAWFGGRQRRFGKTGEQITGEAS